MINIINKKVKTVIGLLSGTSVDGIDTVLLKITGYGVNTKIKVIDFKTYQIPEIIKKAILKNSEDKTAKLSEICRLNIIIGELFADSVKRICRRNSTDLKKNGSVDFIGSHGQTIAHYPYHGNYLKRKVKSTLQIGDPSVIANLTGIVTVGDFRTADCAVQGDGAPLVPFLDYILFRSKTLNRGLLNIGGIANITIIPKSCTRNQVIAFDTGPGNMIVDSLMQRLYKKNFDKDGTMALKGTLDKELFKYLLRDSKYKQRPPKSTGREHYGSEFQNKILKKAGKVPKENIIRTVTEFTAYSILYSYEKFIKPKTKLDELIISGGGAKNPVLIASLKSYMPGMKIKKMNKYGITADSKEAVLFAVLANECLAGSPANMRNVTGSKKDVILGKICLGIKN
ncbi:MAG: anhydro-N-acetylmuramic acid kinase [Ignavibacteria bacterium]